MSNCFLYQHISQSLEIVTRIGIFVITSLFLKRQRSLQWQYQPWIKQDFKVITYLYQKLKEVIFFAASSSNASSFFRTINEAFHELTHFHLEEALFVLRKVDCLLLCFFKGLLYFQHISYTESSLKLCEQLGLGPGRTICMSIVNCKRSANYTSICVWILNLFDNFFWQIFYHES